jgi:hypothetical protein
MPTTTVCGHFDWYSQDIYRERELGYDVLQSTKALCALRSIFNFKSEMIDPSRSI